MTEATLPRVLAIGVANFGRALIPLAGLALVWATPGQAQMQLPGATNGVAAGSAPPAASAEGGSPRGPAKPVVIKAPGEETIAGHRLAHDGARGVMMFDQSGGDFVLSKLTMTGDKISVPTQACSIDVSLAPPMAAIPQGRPQGAIRYAVPLKACPFSIDILEGAVLVSSPAPHCDFTAADCRISAGGLWGPAAADITPQEVKNLERERGRIETTMRANFRMLLKRAGKDRDAVKMIAGEQAGFSSDREVACRDYAQESVHGFCSTRITQARVLALIAKFGGPSDRTPARHPRAKASASPASVPEASKDPGSE